MFPDILLVSRWISGKLGLDSSDTAILFLFGWSVSRTSIELDIWLSPVAHDGQHNIYYTGYCEWIFPNFFSVRSMTDTVSVRGSLNVMADYAASVSHVDTSIVCSPYI